MLWPTRPLSIQLQIAILLLWLIETDVFQLPQLHKHFNVACNFLKTTMTRLFIFQIIFLLSCNMISHQANTLTIDELLTNERSQYMRTFQEGLKQNKTDSSAIEVMLQVTADQNRSQPEIFQLYRYDLINRNKEGKIDLTEFNLDKDSLLKYNQQVFDFNGIEVEINPFVWNGCELTFSNEPKNWNSYYSWAKKWLDIGDNKKLSPDGFQNVIHSVTFPKEENGKWTTSIDFGTAPINSFKELMLTLSGQGIKKIEVHSKTFTE
jgi:hypothetical protein